MIVQQRTDNVKSESTTKCSNYKKLVHLPCIEILVKINQIESPNIKIHCNKCVAEMSNATATNELNVSFNATNSTSKTEKNVNQTHHE